MKVTYLERIENHMAWSGKMYCSQCGAHEYDVVEILEPKVIYPWFVRCPQCAHEAYDSPSREVAIARWKQM